jgi:hypothetical protein
MVSRIGSKSSPPEHNLCTNKTSMVVAEGLVQVSPPKLHSSTTPNGDPSAIASPIQALTLCKETSNRLSILGLGTNVMTALRSRLFCGLRC